MAEDPIKRAARQRAYRERLKSRSATPPPASVETALSAARERGWEVEQAWLIRAPNGKMKALSLGADGAVYAWKVTAP